MKLPEIDEREIEEVLDERVTEECIALVGSHAALVEDRVNPDVSSWRCLSRGLDGQAWEHRGRRLRVIWSIALESDGRPWLHVSASNPARVPFHDEMGLVKDLFVGEHAMAYSVWPPVHRYVNEHATTLHLWAPYWDEATAPMPLPEFSHVWANGRRTI